MVLPEPGGPQRMIDVRSSAAIMRRSGEVGPTTFCWPTNSSRERGRIRAARGAPAGSGGASEGSVNMSGWTPRGGVRLPTRCPGELGMRWASYLSGGRRCDSFGWGAPFVVDGESEVVGQSQSVQVPSWPNS